MLTSHCPPAESHWPEGVAPLMPCAPVHPITAPHAVARVSPNSVTAGLCHPVWVVKWPRRKRWASWPPQGSCPPPRTQPGPPCPCAAPSWCSPQRPSLPALHFQAVGRTRCLLTTPRTPRDGQHRGRSPGVTPGVVEASDPSNWGQRELILTLMRAS